MLALCCLEGEAAFVLFLIMEGFDLDLVAAADTGEPRRLLEKLFARPSVNEAIRRWRKHRRLPTPGRLTWRLARSRPLANREGYAIEGRPKQRGRLVGVTRASREGGGLPPKGPCGDGNFSCGGRGISDPRRPTGSLG